VTAPFAEEAFAKINLTLRVIGRRPDGYHELDSLVVFARISDRLSFTPGPALGLTVQGPTANAAGPTSDNLVLRAASALTERVATLQLGHFTLRKGLPVAAGIGGGSADAAAALRLLAQANGIAPANPRLIDAARATGADVPVCLDPRPRRMRGIGDILSEPLTLPDLPAVLVNPGISVPTKDVFARLGAPLLAAAPGGEADDIPAKREALLDYLAATVNDLEPVAIALQPMIGGVLAALRALPGCQLARMSGSGATCFGLFASSRAATAAAKRLREAQPDWWVRATALGDPLPAA
jgi:4-diphosphocytidyl-2-C-methyl-D-erythritol kinase